MARTTGDPSALAQPSRAALARVDPDLALFDARPMEDRLAGTLATSRFNTRLLAMLGVVGLLLAASGIYGVIGYFVSQRTQEIGVRLALGATPASVVRLVVGQAMGPLAVGALVGVAASLAASRAISSQLFDVSRTDPVDARARRRRAAARRHRGQRRPGAARGGAGSDPGAAG